MITKIAEIADGIFRISTCVPELAPEGFTFNQFLVKAEEPLLFHTGPRAMFPLVSDAVSKIIPIAKLRWITFGHVESDECGSMNQWLEAAPESQVAHGETGVMVSLNDMANRPPRALQDGEVIDTGLGAVDALRVSFDNILVDCGSVKDSTDAALLGSSVDGVVIVVDAGQSRRDEILNSQRMIETAGGKFLGFVLNKRRYPVPEWLYRRL
jgi:hypothetical protein